MLRNPLRDKRRVPPAAVIQLLLQHRIRESEHATALLQLVHPASKRSAVALRHIRMAASSARCIVVGPPGWRRQGSGGATRVGWP